MNTFTLFSRVIAWVFCFVVLKLWTVKQSPLNDDIVDLFDMHKTQKVYQSLTKTYKTAYDENKRVTNQRAEYLELAVLLPFLSS
jgi:hypothetical protein